MVSPLPAAASTLALRVGRPRSQSPGARTSRTRLCEHADAPAHRIESMAAARRRKRAAGCFTHHGKLRVHCGTAPCSRRARGLGRQRSGMNRRPRCASVSSLPRASADRHCAPETGCPCQARCGQSGLPRLRRAAGGGRQTRWYAAMAPAPRNGVYLPRASHRDAGSDVGESPSGLVHLRVAGRSLESALTATGGHPHNTAHVVRQSTASGPSCVVHHRASANQRQPSGSAAVFAPPMGRLNEQGSLRASIAEAATAFCLPRTRRAPLPTTPDQGVIARSSGPTGPVPVPRAIATAQPAS